MFAQIDPKQIVVDRKFQGMCCLPFYGHPNGCPNFGKKHGCPPNSFLETEFLDFSRDMYVIYTKFDITSFSRKMLEMHHKSKNYPRQLCNPRRWQPHTRKLHNENINYFHNLHNSMYLDNSPEARGVNVTALMKTIGIELDWNWPPKQILELEKNNPANIYTLSLAGYLINSPR